MLDIFLVYTFLFIFTFFTRKIKYQVGSEQKYINFVLFLYILLLTFLMCWQDLPN